MKILFYLGHPAHFHLFKNIITHLSVKNDISILTKKKDILDELLNKSGFAYYNILPSGRKDSKFNIALGLIKRDYRMLKYCLKFKPDIMVGTSPEICHVGKFLNIPSINVNEDDANAVSLYAKMSYPFATDILTPESCDNGKWNDKSIKYNSYHELAYLHPNVFNPDENVLKGYNIKKPYYILRFSALNAYHDKGVKGIHKELGLKIIDKLITKGNIYITSERKLEPEFEQYQLNINPLDIYHIIYFSEMYIGDSQTMAAESAVLGVPSLRFNDFAGRLGYLEELEKEYQLTFGFRTNNPVGLLTKIDELLNIKDIKQIWSDRRNKMLTEKIDTTKFFVWFIENYPDSKKILKENPDYQYNFKIQPNDAELSNILSNKK
jgi:predicted glycosyltransferase